MRMIKTYDRNIQCAPSPDGAPAKLIGIARFDDVGSLAPQDFSDRAEIHQRAVASSPRNQRRTNRVDARPASDFDFRFLTGNNEHVLVARGLLLDVVDLLVEITFHSTAHRRVKLR